MERPRAYLAGPDVFLRDPVAFARKKKTLCDQYGFEGVFPLDAVLDLDGLSPRAAGLRISAANEGLIRSSELVIAHVTPFRGPSADVGTAYEMGFARSLGLPVFAYSNVPDDFETRTARAVGKIAMRPDGHSEDPDGMQIESFDLEDNLMLVGAVEGSGAIWVTAEGDPAHRFTSLEGFERCLDAAQRWFAAKGAGK